MKIKKENSILRMKNLLNKLLIKNDDIYHLIQSYFLHFSSLNIIIHTQKHSHIYPIYFYNPYIGIIAVLGRLIGARLYVLSVPLFGTCCSIVASLEVLRFIKNLEFHLRRISCSGFRQGQSDFYFLIFCSLLQFETDETSNNRHQMFSSSS